MMVYGARGVRTVTVAFACGLGIWLAFGGAASAAVVHEREGGFALGGFSWVGVDNSGGPSSGDVYVGQVTVEFPAGFSAGSVRQLDADGTATGVELQGSETPAGSFGFASTPDPFAAKLSDGVAVDGSAGSNAGDVYIADVEHGVVDRFDETGAFVCQITGTKPITPGEEEDECAGAAGSETPGGGTSPLSVAVDPGSGALAVGDASGVVYRFNATGEFLGEIADSHITEPGSLAFDSAGNLYVVNGNSSPVLGGGEGLRFSPAGNFESVVTATSSDSVGVDLGTDHVYFGSKSGEIEEYDSGGALVAKFGEGGQVSVDANASTGRLYVTPPALFGGEGQIWSGDIFAPRVTTGAASAVEETSATVSGQVDPEIPAGGSPIEACEFEYGTSDEYGNSVACAPPTPYSNETDVSAGLSGLTPGTTYHYRLVAANSETTGAGEDRTFATFGPPSISGEVSIARTTSATVKAQIDPAGSETTCAVEYVDEAAFLASAYAGAATAPCAETLAAGFGDQIASAMLGGLRIGTIYHFRFRATNSAGTTTGEDHTFATFGIESFSLETLDEEGKPYTQAGGHPYAMKVSLALNTTSSLTDRNEHGESASANLRTVRVELPPGLIGDPTAAPNCEPYKLALFRCPGASQVGTLTAISTTGASNEASLYNLVPQRGIAAQIGSRFNDFVTVRIDAGVRTGSDYGVTADSLFVTADEAVTKVDATLWGVPAAEGHDGERYCPGPEPRSRFLCPGTAPHVPFLANPTSCSGPLTTILRIDSWQEPGNFVSASSQSPPTTGCDRLEFKPTIAVKPEASAFDSPTGLHVNLHLPQNQDPIGLAEADLRDTTVKLPAGLAVNAAAATGLDGCAPPQIELHGPDPASCPDASKIGTVEVDTPLLDHPLPGNVYVATPGENPFGSLLAIYVAVHDPISGVVVKLAGMVTADSQTGQLTTTFNENPQLPFEDFKLDFFAGPQAALTTPLTCGTYTTTTEMTPWTSPAGKGAQPFSAFQINSGPDGAQCADVDEQPNHPAFSAGTANPVAGAFSQFVLKLSREDGSQRFSRIDTVLPPGLVGRLAGVAYCPDDVLAAVASRPGAQELASPSCPAASQVGSIDVGVGSGSQPYHAGGEVYLAGPYRGAPLSLAIVTPAVAGPFDLGTVVVRAALRVDPVTAQITAESDPIPVILQGIPLDVRSIVVTMNRPKFTLNPTSCREMAVGGQEISVFGQIAPLSSRFEVGGCRDLAFRPGLHIRLFGPTTRSGHPRLRAVVTAKPGEANIARTTVTLPDSEFLDQAHIKTVCTRVQFNADQCPQGSIYGRARALTPLLDAPLQGPVYLRSNGGERTLPDLVAVLRGPANQPIEVDLVGFIDSRHGGLRTRFENVPDAPVSKFTLTMQGGRKGLLVNSTNLCKAINRATVRMRGQNGADRSFRSVVKNDCKNAKHDRSGHG
jgi:hypothetical protein